MRCNVWTGMINRNNTCCCSSPVRISYCFCTLYIPTAFPYKSTSNVSFSILPQQIDIAKEYATRQSGKELINLVVIGHVDAGKSTLMGHLLYLLGQVNQRQMHKYETESKKKGKASFAYAWVLDETGEERER